MTETTERRAADQDQPGSTSEQHNGEDVPDLEPEEDDSKEVKGGPTGQPWAPQ
jgi:hypothetical protein